MSGLFHSLPLNQLWFSVTYSFPWIQIFSKQLEFLFQEFQDILNYLHIVAIKCKKMCGYSHTEPSFQRFYRNLIGAWGFAVLKKWKKYVNSEILEWTRIGENWDVNYGKRIFQIHIWTDRWVQNHKTED